MEVGEDRVLEFKGNNFKKLEESSVISTGIGGGQCNLPLNKIISNL